MVLRCGLPSRVYYHIPGQDNAFTEDGWPDERMNDLFSTELTRGADIIWITPSCKVNKQHQQEEYLQ